MVADGLPARFVLSILQSAGILYAALSPVIVSGLAQLPTFTPESAGYVFSANMAGTAVGGLIAVLLVQHLRWRRTSVLLLTLLIALDFFSTLTNEVNYLYTLRFAHGVTGGLLIGVALSVISRQINPERTLSICIMLQLIVAGALTAVLTPLLDTVGPPAIWFSLIGLSVLGLALMPLLGEYPVAPVMVNSDGSRRRAPWIFVIPIMVALWLYQAGEMAAFAYVIEIGLAHGFAVGFVGTVVATSLWSGGPGALFVTWWSTRSGRLLPLLISLMMMAASVALLTMPAAPAFLLANVGFGICFGISFPYLMGVAAELDNTGQMGSVAAFAGNLGLASGPMAAGYLASDGQYGFVLVFAVAAIVVAGLLAVAPARMLDRKNRTGKVIW